MPLSWTYRITQYDPADRDESGAYVGDVEAVSDEGPREAAYLDAVEAFARDLGVTHLEVRDPSVRDPDDPGAPDRVEGDPDGPDGPLVQLFGRGLTGFVDGALVDIASARLLVRGMLRFERFAPGWCRLESPHMTVHVGWDVYMFITTSRPCPQAQAATAAAGLFAELSPGSTSPYAWDEAEEARWRSVHTPVDDAFWARIDALVHEHGAVLLEEDAAWTRWHRLTPDDPRPTLRPRCRVWVWPDLTTDVPAVLAHLDVDDPDDLTGAVVWLGPDGHVHDSSLDEDTVHDLRAHLAGATRAGWRSSDLDDVHPLIEAVLPDDDGVVRARWQPLDDLRGL